MLTRHLGLEKDTNSRLRIHGWEVGLDSRAMRVEFAPDFGKILARHVSLHDGWKAGQAI